MKQFLCSRAKITISRQMKTWDMLVKEVTPPFERRADIPWTANISPKNYKVFLTTLARIRKKTTDPSWVTGDHSIQSIALVRESFVRGKVYQILKDRNFIRLRFITSDAVVNNPYLITSRGWIGVYPNQIQSNACILK